MSHPVAATQGRGVALMVLSALLACFGQFCWKLGASDGIAWILVGLVLYGLGAVSMLVAYRFGELSVLQPILGLSYALSLVLGAVWLDEHISLGRVVGVIAVIAGVTLIARSAERTSE